jgi:phosphocarrier protein NPr
MKFQAKVTISRNGTQADAKSMIDDMMMACPQGTELQLLATGADAEAAIDAIDALFKSGFDEAY